jgi:hypothetical protein
VRPERRGEDNIEKKTGYEGALCIVLLFSDRVSVVTTDVFCVSDVQ